MERIILILLVAFALQGCGGVAAAGNAGVHPNPQSQYVLFSWKKHRNSFCFALMSEKRREEFIKGPHNGFRKLCTLSELQAALNTLPKPAYVMWNSWPEIGADYPSDPVVNRLKLWAEQRNIHISIEPATD
jgi:hypothetical protein